MQRNSTLLQLIVYMCEVGMSLSEIERHFILATLEHFGGDKRKAAEILGISLKTIYNRLNNYSATV